MGSHEHTPSVSADNVRWDKVREARRKVAQGLDQDEHARVARDGGPVDHAGADPQAHGGYLCSLGGGVV